MAAAGGWATAAGSSVLLFDGGEGASEFVRSSAPVSRHAGSDAAARPGATRKSVCALHAGLHTSARPSTAVRCMHHPEDVAGVVTKY
jgi:hypothetical protein